MFDKTVPELYLQYFRLSFGTMEHWSLGILYFELFPTLDWLLLPISLTRLNQTYFWTRDNELTSWWFWCGWKCMRRHKRFWIISCYVAQSGCHYGRCCSRVCFWLFDRFDKWFLLFSRPRVVGSRKVKCLNVSKVFSKNHVHFHIRIGNGSLVRVFSWIQSTMRKFQTN